MSNSQDTMYDMHTELTGAEMRAVELTRAKLAYDAAFMLHARAGIAAQKARAAEFRALQALGRAEQAKEHAELLVRVEDGGAA